MKVSVITACFNSESTIEETVTSVINQTHKNIEYLIVDGKSTDNTLKILCEYDESISYIISETDNGIYDAINKGITMATGEVIAILNSDDYFAYNDVLTDVITIFKHYPEIDLVFGDVAVFKEKSGRRIIRWMSAKSFRVWQMRFGMMPPHPGVFVRSRVYDQIGLFNTRYKICADFDFLIRAMYVHRLKFKVLRESPITMMRVGGISTLGYSSYKLITKEFMAGLKANGLYTNSLIINSRFIAKSLQYVGAAIRFSGQHF